MKEQLYTIPVNDAFDTDCECPVCAMKKALEEDAVEFTMGPSYMEDDIRMVTDKIGFCEKHVQKLYENQNRLGLALMLNTHMKKTIADLESLSKEKVTAASIFKKKADKPSGVVSYIQSLNSSCFVCSRVEKVYARYLATIFYCYAHDAGFRKKLTDCKGLCTTHFGALYELAPKELSGQNLQDFIEDITSVYLSNMKRVQEDLEWFTDKFDYRNENAPWKNSKDALPRSITKTNSILS